METLFNCMVPDCSGTTDFQSEDERAYGIVLCDPSMEGPSMDSENHFVAFLEALHDGTASAWIVQNIRTGHTAFSYKLLTVLRKGLLTDEQEALLRATLRQAGNEAAERVERTLADAGVHITVCGTIDMDPA